MDNDIKNKIVSMYLKKKYNGEKNIYKKISNTVKEIYDVDISSEGIRSIVRRASVDGVDISHEDNDINHKISLTGKNDILKSYGYDPDNFELVRMTDSEWNKGSKNGTLKSSKIIVKPKYDFQWNTDFIERLFDSISPSKLPNRHVQKSNFTNNGKALILPIADLHYGLLASRLTSKEEYNTNITDYIYSSILNDIMSRTKDMKFEKIFFTMGSDMINCDNKSGTTTKGTPQSNDGDIEKFIINVTNMLHNTIELLRSYSNVEVIYISGNHDSLSSFGIANALRMLYKNCEDVSVDFRPVERKYKQFGKTLIGFSHNLDIKYVNDIVQSEARHLLSSTNNTLYLLQHLHHEIALDKSGTDVRVLPTISPLSRWGYEKGYNSVRKCQSFILDEEFGITDILYSYVKG